MYDPSIARTNYIYVGACYTRGAGFRRSCGGWGKRGRWRGAGGMDESYVMDGIHIYIWEQWCHVYFDSRFNTVFFSRCKTLFSRRGEHYDIQGLVSNSSFRLVLAVEGWNQRGLVTKESPILKTHSPGMEHAACIHWVTHHSCTIPLETR